MPLPANLKGAVDDVLARGTVIDVGRHTVTDQLLWAAVEKYVPVELWKELARLKADRFPRRRRDEDATY